MNTRTKIAVIAAVILLVAGGIVFAQSSGNDGQRWPPFNLDENYPRPYGGGYGGCGGCCGGRW
jgi:hypothetical protein